MYPKHWRICANERPTDPGGAPSNCYPYRDLPRGRLAARSRLAAVAASVRRHDARQRGRGFRPLGACRRMTRNRLFCGAIRNSFLVIGNGSPYMSAARHKSPSGGAAIKPKRRSARSVSTGSIPSRPSRSEPSLAQSLFSEQRLWISLGLVAANLLVYGPVWHSDFVTWDDPAYVTDNLIVSAGLSWKGFLWALTTGYFTSWHPLTWLSLMLDAQIYGANPGAYHLTNLLLHIASTVLLFGVLHLMTGALGRSAFVAALFAVHPLHVESVAWISERKDVLSTLFWILTLWAYWRYARQPRLRQYLIVLLLFACGLMSKPMVVTLPFVLLLLDFWPLDRVPLGTDRHIVGHPNSREGLEEPSVLDDKRRKLLKLILEKIPLLALAVLSSIVTFVVQRKGGAVAGLEVFPLRLRVSNVLVSYVAYIANMLWPARLAAFYPYPRSIPAWRVIGGGMVVAGITAAVFWAAQRYRYLPVGWLWYLGTLVPVIGLVQVGSQSRADRYTYVPLIGLFIIVAWGAGDLLTRWRHQALALPAAAVVILACGIKARGQVSYWNDNLSFWGHSIDVTPDNYFAHNNLGLFLVSQGRVDEGISHYSEAVRIQPGFAETHNNLALALVQQGKLDEAIAHYREALHLRPGYMEAHNSLGLALVAQGKFDEAITHYQEALRIDRGFAAAHNNLANALAKQGKLNEAVAQYAEAIRLYPNFAVAHYDFGDALAEQGKVDEAIQQFLEALRLSPQRADWEYNLAVMYYRKGDTADAIHHFQAVLQINPRHQAARRALEELEKQGNETDFKQIETGSQRIEHRLRFTP